MRTRLLLALGAALGLLAPASANAAFPAHPGVTVAPVPSWVEVAEAAVGDPPAEPEVASAALHYLLVDDQVLADGSRSSEYTHVVYRILTSAGLDTGSQHEIGFDPSFARVAIHHLRVHRRGAWSDRLADAHLSVVQRESNFSRQLYDGSLSVLLVLRDVQVGDLVSLAYTVEGSNPVFGDRWSGGVAMGWAVPVDRRRVRALAPTDRTLLHRLHGTDRPACRVNDRGRWREHVWDLEDLPALRSEPYTPGHWDAFPWLQLTQFGSWAEVVDWAVPLYRPAATARPEVAGLAAALRSSAQSDDEALLAAIRWVQDEVRYFGIMLGPNSHAPHPPDETIRNRFGDCKDKALLLIALLGEIGAEAWPVLVDLDDGEALPERLPSPQDFDHVVVLLRSGHRELWVDPTVSLQGGTLTTLHLPVTGHALVVRPGEDDLTYLPADSTEPGITRAEYEYVVDPTGDTVEVTIATSHERSGADDLRAQLAEVTREHLTRRYVRFYSQAAGRVEPTAELEIRDDRATNRLTTVERYRLVDCWEVGEDGSETFDLLPLLMDDLLDTPVETDRRCPLRVPRRLRQSETVAITAGPDWQLEAVEVNQRNPWFVFRASSRGRLGRIELEYHLETLAVDVDPEDVAAYLEAVETFRDNLTYTLTLGGGRPPERGSTAAAIALAGVIAVALVLFATVAWALRRGGLV